MAVVAAEVGGRVTNLNGCCRERAAHPGMIVSSQFVIIHDKFPKAKLHGLVIARDPALVSPENLTADHLPLLEQMQARPATLVCNVSDDTQTCL